MGISLEFASIGAPSPEKVIFATAHRGWETVRGRFFQMERPDFS